MNNEINIPGFNWFVHSLVDNVGKVDWVKMTEEELTAAMKEHGDSVYPYNVVKQPIAPGKKIVLEDGKVEIDCGSQKVRDYIIHLAIEHQTLERKCCRLEQEKRSSVWKPVSELPPHQGYMSRPDWYHCIVDSPILHYVEGVTFGVRSGGKWYIYINGKEVKHPVTHYREIPPHAEDTVPYEQVKDEVEKLRKLYEKQDVAN